MSVCKLQRVGGEEVRQLLAQKRDARRDPNTEEQLDELVRPLPTIANHSSASYYVFFCCLFVFCLLFGLTSACANALRVFFCKRNF